MAFQIPPDMLMALLAGGQSEQPDLIGQVPDAQMFTPAVEPMPHPGFLQSMAEGVLGNVPMMGQQRNRFGELPGRGTQALGIIGPLLAHGVAGAMRQGTQAKQQAVAAENARGKAVADWMNENSKATRAQRLKTAGALTEQAGTIAQQDKTLAVTKAGQKAEADRFVSTSSETERHNRATEAAAARTAALAAKKQSESYDPSWMGLLVHTTPLGAKTLDLSGVSPKEQKQARIYAASIGAVPVTKEQQAKLNNLGDARDNIAQMGDQAKTFLPQGRNAINRAIVGGANVVAGATGANPIIAAWPTWRISAIQQLVALAGGMGSGLRINQAEIRQAVENDIPRITDNLDTAQQKMANITILLDNAERSITTAPDAGIWTTIGSDGKRHLSLSKSATDNPSTVKMRSPNRQITEVPANMVEHYKALGATVVR